MSIMEGLAVNTNIVQLATNDPDVGDTFSYSLVGGTGSDDNSSFNISSGYLRSSFVYDYESKSSYLIRIRSTDNGLLFVEKAFTVTILNENEVPTLSISEPDGSLDSVEQGTVFSITMSANDNDSAATFALYYKSTSTGCSTGLSGWTNIVSGLSENTTQYNWDTASIPYGSYYICGVINDGTTSVYAISSGQMLIFDRPNLTINEPSGADDMVGEGGTFAVIYTAEDSDSPATTALYYRNGSSAGCNAGGIGDWTMQATGLVEGSSLSYSWTLPTGFGQYFICGAIYDGISTVYALSPSYLTVNAAPTLAITEPNGSGDSISQGSAYIINFGAADSDDAATFSLYYKNASSGCSSGLTGWTSLTTNLAEYESIRNWDTTGVPYGNYYICGVINDGVNSSVYSISSGPVTITALPFISSWKTDNTSTGSSSNNQVKLPLDFAGTYNFVVQWGDGNSDTITSYNQAETTHTYSAAGTYTVTISGTITGWKFDNVGDRLKLLNISQWGSLKFGNTGYYFYGAQNLQITATDIPDLSGTTSLYFTFASCQALTTVPNMGSWNMAGVTNIGFMFYDATAFNQNISAWNTANITNMGGAFYNAQVFNQNISSWNTASVTGMGGMFGYAYAFNQNIGTWNTANVLDMSQMFYYATAFNQNISTWNTGNVLNMNNMFRRTVNFQQNLNSWNTSNVENMSYMFSNSNFNSPIGQWNTGKVTNMRNMFNAAVSFNQDIGSWNTISVTNMMEMFYGATVFNQNIGAWNTANVINMNGMFSYANAFNQPIGSWDTSKVTNMAGIFLYCQAFNQDIGDWNTANVVSSNAMFYEATVFNQDISTWNTANFTGLTNMFYKAYAFNQPIGSWNVANVNEMINTFYNATSFNQNLNSWNTVKVTTMTQAFSGATAFNQDISNWNLGLVTTVAYMFYGATSFNQNLGKWSLSSVTQLSELFTNTAIDTRNYDAMLISWSKQTLNSGRSISFGTAKYSGGTAAAARAIFSTIHGWTISDGGQSTIYPTSGAFGATTNLTSTTFTLNWTRSTDTVTAQSSLTYFVCSGPNAAAIDTVAECLSATGEMASFEADRISLAFTGATPGSTYYYNVIVVDGDINPVIYDGKTVTTNP